jgi:hypothetical protein
MMFQLYKSGTYFRTIPSELPRTPGDTAFAPLKPEHLARPEQQSGKAAASQIAKPHRRAG